MYICPETRKPKSLKQVKSLLIDKNKGQADFSHLPPTVCLSLNGTLFHKATPSEAEKLEDPWLHEAVSINCDGRSHVVIPRPGALDLLLELDKYACPMIYSSQKEGFIEAALLQLAISLTDTNRFDDESDYERSDAYMDHCVWSQDQCIAGIDGYQKSLGTLSEFTDNGINDIWLIDHKPELVDFPSHVISVSEFFGDPFDRDLFRVADQIFMD
jgi:hypothetical protein